MLFVTGAIFLRYATREIDLVGESKKLIDNLVANIERMTKKEPEK
ncbi:MAG: hypothetical protein ACR2PF_06575 [Rhizobiaceae bacterium]